MVGNYGDSGPPTPIAYSPQTLQFTDLSAAIPGAYQFHGGISGDSPQQAYGKDEGVNAATAIATNGDIVGAMSFRHTLYADGSSVPWDNTSQDTDDGIYLFQHAFIYTGGVTTDLNTYILGSTGWLLQGATGVAVVNGQDWIVGDGLVDGVHHAFLMTPATPGDANTDGRVDINDLTIVLSNYGQTGATWAQGEFTGSGTVDINDLTIVLANYGAISAAGASSAAVPEPGVLAMLAAALVGLLAWTQRTRK